MTAAEELVEAARGVSLADAAPLLGLKLRGRAREHPQPCPKCGGRDRFSLNTAKNEWVCRGEGVGGGDAIGMAAHVLDLDTRSRAGFLGACSAVTGLPVPDGEDRESAADRAARLARLDEARRRNAEALARAEADQTDFREAERRRARGIYRAAGPLARTPAEAYLRRRAGGLPPGSWLGFSAGTTYWHGQDERGHPVDIFHGPAMIAPFVVFDTAEGQGSARRPPESSGAPAQGRRAAASGAPRERDHTVIGCHITWIDIANPPKLRPSIVDPATGEILPTKKMRGSKKGGLIPIAGACSAARWVGGEGIENVAAIGAAEGWRGDTFYFAAGDLGNLAGPAEPSARFAHPTLTKPDRKGVERPVMVPGPVPRAGQAPDDAMPVPDHVTELVLLADGDSEAVFTTSAMVRARARLARPGRLIPVVWPLPGTDFAGLLAGRSEDFGAD